MSVCDNDTDRSGEIVSEWLCLTSTLIRLQKLCEYLCQMATP